MRLGTARHLGSEAANKKPARLSLLCNQHTAALWIIAVNRIGFTDDVIPMTSSKAAEASLETPREENAKAPSGRAPHGLDWLNFLLADVQTGVGPFLAIYLAGCGWNEQRVGFALRPPPARWSTAFDRSAL